MLLMLAVFFSLFNNFDDKYSSQIENVKCFCMYKNKSNSDFPLSLSLTFRYIDPTSCENVIRTPSY